MGASWKADREGLGVVSYGADLFHGALAVPADCEIRTSSDGLGYNPGSRL